jgi:vesicle-fusing ATPase
MVGLNAIQRRLVKVSTGDKILCSPYEPPVGGAPAAVITAEIDFVSKKTVRGPDVEFNAQELIEHLTSRFTGQVVTVHQQVTFEYQGVNYLLTVKSIIGTDTDSDNLTIHRGQLLKETEIVFETRPGSGIKVVGQRTMASTQLFKQKEFNFEKLGIGGLDAQFEKIFRRAFASRIFPPAMLDRLGIHHVKGVLLYGPPGRCDWIFL